MRKFNKANRPEAVGPYDDYGPYANKCESNKLVNGANVLCAHGWVIYIKPEKNYFGFAEAKGVAMWTSTGDDTASVSVILSRNGVDYADMSGIFSNFNGNPKVFNLTSADEVDSGSYKLRLEVTSY